MSHVCTVNASSHVYYTVSITSRARRMYSARLHIVVLRMSAHY